MIFQDHTIGIQLNVLTVGLNWSVSQSLQFNLVTLVSGRSQFQKAKLPPFEQYQNSLLFSGLLLAFAFRHGQSNNGQDNVLNMEPHFRVYANLKSLTLRAICLMPERIL